MQAAPPPEAGPLSPGAGGLSPPDAVSRAGPRLSHRTGSWGPLRGFLGTRPVLPAQRRPLCGREAQALGRDRLHPGVRSLRLVGDPQVTAGRPAGARGPGEALVLLLLLLRGQRPPLSSRACRASGQRWETCTCEAEACGRTGRAW